MAWIGAWAMALQYVDAPKLDLHIIKKKKKEFMYALVSFLYIEENMHLYCKKKVFLDQIHENQLFLKQVQNPFKLFFVILYLEQ